MIKILKQENNTKTTVASTTSAIPVNFDTLDSLKWYISGLIDAEGCFGVNIVKKDSSQTGYVFINHYITTTIKGRTYSTHTGPNLPLKLDCTLDPFFLTGFIDGEGCFCCQNG